MNKYPTEHIPLGSTDVKVLFNNASNLDDAMNSDAVTWVDRFGRNRRSISGIEAEFEQRLDQLGYYGFDNVYAAGLVLDSRAEIFLKDGEYYRLSASAPVPYTMTGTWATDGPLMVAVGDAALRAQLSSASGTDYVFYNNAPLTYAIGRVKTPEQYGAVGAVGVGNAAADTAAIASWLADLEDGDVLRAQGSYLVAGSPAAAPSRRDYTVDLTGAKFQQTVNFSKTLRFTAPLGSVKIKGGTFLGRGGAAGEYDGVSSSYNGVAAIQIDGGECVTFEDITGREHAGGFICCFGLIEAHYVRINDRGIGYPWIDPVGQGNQGNGSDFSIMNQPLDNSLGWVYIQTYTDCHLRDHAFGVQTVQTKAAIFMGGIIGPCPGQHGIYGIENDGFVIVGTRFVDCYQFAVKTQFENYAGFYIGPVWAPATAYAVGAVVRFSSILWECTVAHTSGPVFLSANWKVDSRYRRKGLSWTGFTVDGCGYGLGLISSSASDPYDEYNRVGQIKDVTITNTVNAAMNLDRSVDISVSDVVIDICEYGIFGRSVSGEFSNVTVRNASKNACAVSVYDTLSIRDCDFVNSGISGTGDDQKAAVLTYALGATGLPSAVDHPHPTIYFDNNKLRWPTGEAPGAALVLDGDTAGRLDWEITNTRGTTTTKKFNIAGNVVVQYLNHFSPNGYVNTAQNEPTFNLSNWTTNFNFDANGSVTDQADVIATLMSVLGGKNVIRKTG